jgi:hypothetical protein
MPHPHTPIPNTPIPYTSEDIVLCTYIARYGTGLFTESKVAAYGGRSVDSVKLKVGNIVAMLDEKGIERRPGIAPITGMPRGETGRHTNWSQVEHLVTLDKADLWAQCKNMLMPPSK